MMELKQGNKYTITYSVKNKDGSIKDLTSTQSLTYALGEARHKPPLLTFDSNDSRLSITDPINGVIKLVITSASLANLKEGVYLHEVRQVNALGDPSILISEKLHISSSLIKE